MERLTGTIERVTFHNEQNGFAVLKVLSKQHRGLTTVVGSIASATPGEFIEAEGIWVMNPEYGKQFQAESIRASHPANTEGMRKYLASGLMRGIGPHYAARLVDTFGEDVFEVIENAPERLLEVEGIGSGRQEAISAAWSAQRVMRDIMVFLQGHGLGTARAVRIYKTFGDDAVGRIKRDPYCLARDIRGIGFRIADQLAEKLGVKRDSPLRARAGLAYVLQELTGQGHCAYPQSELVEKAAELLEIEDSVIFAALEHEVSAERLVREVLDAENFIYLENLHRAELGLVQRLGALLAQPHPMPDIDIDAALEWVEQGVGLELAEAQRQAVRLAVTEKVLVITGGPGVGKTTVVDSILRVLRAKDLECVLCAPTGRAAKRLTEATRHPARTIHRLLEFDPREFGFKRNADLPIEADVVLIDEVSMLDVPLANAVMQAVPDGAALIVVGDVDQLPSVGPGRVLGDMIESDRVPVVRLSHIFRQADESRIVHAAHSVNHGELPDLEPHPDSDFYFVKGDTPEIALERIVELVSGRIPQRFGFDPFREIQVLTPMVRGILGAQNLNQVLQEALNPPVRGALEVDRFGQRFRQGDKILQAVNNYDKDVFNGDLGRVDSIDAEAETVVLEFDGRRIEYEVGELDEVLPAYAMTIHKSQGSEFPAIVVPIHTQHFVMLQRNLLYTAMTRGKRLVVLVGSTRAIARAVDNATARLRHSGLCNRLCGLQAS